MAGPKHGRLGPAKPVLPAPSGKENDVTTVAFCGLGQMGEPMAARLLDGDDELVVWNRSAERADALVERGARRAASPAEAAAGVEVVITMLSTPEALDEVVFGDEGVASGVEAGATLVETSTVGPDALRRLAERLPDGVHVLDAPVLGSVSAATDGSLKLFVGGPAELVERWRPVLERLGTIHHLGPLGSGAAMKLVANSTLATLMTAWAKRWPSPTAWAWTPHRSSLCWPIHPSGPRPRARGRTSRRGPTPPTSSSHLPSRT